MPRAALAAGALAKDASFFSFGSNDLTQTTLGLSRDDSAGFLAAYRRQGLLTYDPFETLDTAGVGELMAMACERGRAARRDLELGVCGEHAGDAASIAFFERLGLDYVSCRHARAPLPAPSLLRPPLSRCRSQSGALCALPAAPIARARRCCCCCARRRSFLLLALALPPLCFTPPAQPDARSGGAAGCRAGGHRLPARGGQGGCEGGLKHADGRGRGLCYGDVGSEEAGSLRRAGCGGRRAG